jgi:hypothetical protein
MGKLLMNALIATLSLSLLISVLSCTKSTNETPTPAASPATSMTYPGIGSQWTYTVTYSDPIDNCYNNSTQIWTVEALNITPTKPKGASITPDSISCIKLHGDYGNEVRYSTWGYEYTIQSFDEWESTLNKVTVYGVENMSPVGGQQLTEALAFSDYTLIGGTNIGVPLTVGSSWKCDIASEIIGLAGSAAKGAGPTAVVEANNQSVTLADGVTTLNDCVQVNYYDPFTNKLLYTRYSSPTVKWMLVKRISYGTYNGIETRVLSTYSLSGGGVRTTPSPTPMPIPTPLGKVLYFGASGEETLAYYPASFVIGGLLASSGNFSMFYNDVIAKIPYEIYWAYDPHSPKAGCHSWIDPNTGKHFVALSVVPASISDAFMIAHEIEGFVVEQEGFRLTNAKQAKFSFLAAALNTMVFQQLIDSRLKEVYGFDPRDSYQNYMQQLMNSLNASPPPTPSDEDVRMAWVFSNVGVALGWEDVLGIDSSKNDYLTWFAQHYPDMAKDQENLLTLVRQIGYDTPAKEAALLQTIIQRYGLEDKLSF